MHHIRIIHLLTFCVLMIHASGQSEDNKDYHLLWADEFNADGEVNTQYWGFEKGFVRNQELQWYQEDNAYCKKGCLVIEARQEKRPNPDYKADSKHWKDQRQEIAYTSASITTQGKFDFQYGRMEVRAKVSNLAGTWPAIWTLGNSCEWPSNGEVDIMENYRGMILANYAWGTDTRWQAKWDSKTIDVKQLGDNWEDCFHIWRLDWDKDEMKIYLDDSLLNAVDLNTTFNGAYHCEGKNPFRQAHYIILNLAIGGQQGGDPNLSPFPNSYLVDYIRVYQKK